MTSIQDSNSPIRVLLFGLGAIGGFYAWILSRNHNVELTVVARSNYGSVKAEGLHIDSVNHGKHHVQFDHVLNSVSQCHGTYDYIVCVNKATAPTAVPPLFRAVTDENTTFVVLQNGVGNEEFFQNVYPNNTVLSGVIWVHASLQSPNTVKHYEQENTEIGLHRNELLPQDKEVAKLNRFCALMIVGGTKVDVVDDIQVKRWEKVIWNAAWNPITMLTMTDTRRWLSEPEAKSTTIRLFKEAITVGRAAGVKIEYDLVDRLMSRINAMPGVMASMSTDARESRAMEVDVILGVIVRKSKELGIDTPVLTTLYALADAVNNRIARPLIDRGHGV